MGITVQYYNVWKETHTHTHTQITHRTNTTASVTLIVLRFSAVVRDMDVHDSWSIAVFFCEKENSNCGNDWSQKQTLWLNCSTVRQKSLFLPVVKVLRGLDSGLSLLLGFPDGGGLCVNGADCRVPLEARIAGFFLERTFEASGAGWAACSSTFVSTVENALA